MASMATTSTGTSNIATTLRDDLTKLEQQLDALEKALASRLRAEMAEYEEIDQELTAVKEQRDALSTAAETAEIAIDDALQEIAKVSTHAAA